MLITCEGAAPATLSLRKEMEMASQLAPRTHPLSRAATEAEALLRRYPTLESRELDRLVAIFPDLAILDIGLMSMDADLSKKLDRFRQDHADRLEPSAAKSIMFVLTYLALPVMMTIGFLWWMLS
jgi:nitric oxide reductase activation protein